MPTYHDLGDHTETMQVRYNADEISYDKLLKLFWENHNPSAVTSLQYQSIIFYHDEEQKALAEESKELVSQKTIKRVTTKILPYEKFWDAENYHQKYLLRRQTGIFRSLGLSDAQVKASTVAAKLTGYLGGFGTLDALDKEIDSWKLSDLQVKAIRSIVASNSAGSGVACSR